MNKMFLLAVLLVASTAAKANGWFDANVEVNVSVEVYTDASSSSTNDNNKD